MAPPRAKFAKAWSIISKIGLNNLVDRDLYPGSFSSRQLRSNSFDVAQEASSVLQPDEWSYNLVAALEQLAALGVDPLLIKARIRHEVESRQANQSLPIHIRTRQGITVPDLKRTCTQFKAETGASDAISAERHRKACAWLDFLLLQALDDLAAMRKQVWHLEKEKWARIYDNANGDVGFNTASTLGDIVLPLANVSAYALFSAIFTGLKEQLQNDDPGYHETETAKRAGIIARFIEDTRGSQLSWQQRQLFLRRMTCELRAQLGWPFRSPFTEVDLEEDELQLLHRRT